MNNSVFSLRLLSDDDRLRVIKSFDYLQLISFSFISTKTKSLVESFNLNIRSFDVRVSGALNISIYPDVDGHYIEFSSFQDTNRGPREPPSDLSFIPSKMRVRSDMEDYDRYEDIKWQNPILSFSLWFYHVCGLFKCNNCHISFDEEREYFDTIALRNLLSQWKLLHITQASRDHAQKIIKLFTPIVEEMFPMHSITHLECPQRFMIHNFKFLSITEDINLDDALAANASCITFMKFTVSNANRFLRSWVRGSNPRLRKAYIRIEGPMNQDTILKGITHQIMPEDLVREWDAREHPRGGVDIRNKKGILATLTLNMHIGISCIRLYIFN